MSADAELALTVLAVFDERGADELRGDGYRWIPVPLLEFGEAGRPEWLTCMAGRHAGQGIGGRWVELLANTESYTFIVWSTCAECHRGMVETPA